MVVNIGCQGSGIRVNGGKRPPVPCFKGTVSRQSDGFYNFLGLF